VFGSAKNASRATPFISFAAADSAVTHAVEGQP
jgi:hypothetical protein